jgi:hypothetical protein
MSLQEAKSVLGFPPGASPTPEEINKAFKARVMENHPDRGGSHEKMVEVNVAKDILDGKGRATWQPDRSPKPPSWSGAGPYKRDPREQKKVEFDATIEGQDFAKAMGDSGAPAGVEWKFVSVPEYYWETTSHPGHKIWVLYGQTDQKHIFLGLKERGESAGGVLTDKGFTKIMQDWQSSMIDIPVSQNVAKIAPKYLKAVGMAWADAKPKNGPRKYVAWPGGKPTEAIMHKIPRSGGAALKDILTGTGLLNDDDPSVAGRKSVVEVYTKYSKERYEKAKKLKAEGKVKSLDAADQYDFFVRVNGKDCQLEDDTIVKMKRSFIPWVLSWEVSEGRPKNLTRMTGRGMLKFDAGTAIRELANCLTGEPSWLHISLEKAAEEYEPEVPKTAAWVDVRLQTTLKQASEALGVSMMELFHELHGV